jgi:hypothetical protein
MARKAVSADLSQYALSKKAVARGRKAFARRESRDLFYKVAIELIDLVRRGATRVSLEEALAVLLQTWNRTHYRFKPFDEAHFLAIRELLRRHRSELARSLTAPIERLDAGRKDRIVACFQAFETVLGPVGAAKTLHLLAPGFFPLWDRAIATHYGVSLGSAGSNGERYWRFMDICRYQSSGLSRGTHDRLKAIDEYNYCRYTKRWI